MALIYFYDASELDRAQLTRVLKDTDHRWEFDDGSHAKLKTYCLSLNRV